MLKMYKGNKPNPTNSQVHPGSMGDAEVTTARECFAIFDACQKEGRFPGEHVKFLSHTSHYPMLSEVLAEACGYGAVNVQETECGGYIFSKGDRVVGFVVPCRIEGCYSLPAMGVAYIGG